MKYLYSFRLAVFFIICASFGSSCKKVTHATRPTPGNYRLLSYTKIRTDSVGVVLNENYRFFYDGSNRVSQILYTTNDTSQSDKSIKFSYNADSIIKTTTRVKTNLVIETDTFIHDANGFITLAYTPYTITTYQYFGKLLSRISQTVDSSFMSLTVTNTITSNNIDFLNSLTGTLTANFVNLTTPLAVDWTIYPLRGTAAVTTTHNNVSGLSDQFTNYGGDPVTVTGTDVNSVTQSMLYAGGNWFNQAFGVYPDKTNRIGDYLQLSSFTYFGSNIYQTNHLLNYIYRPLDTTRVKYTIDADSKITTTDVTFKDYHNRYWYESYKLQYETY
jgi:hypothetical protein